MADVRCSGVRLGSMVGMALDPPSTLVKVDACWMLGSWRSSIIGSGVDLGGVGGTAGSLPNPLPPVDFLSFLAKREVGMCCDVWGMTNPCVVAKRTQAIAKSFIVDWFICILLVLVVEEIYVMLF